MYFEIYKSGDDWRWRLKGGNHKIIAAGQGYSNKSDCLAAVSLLQATTTQTPINYL